MKYLTYIFILHFLFLPRVIQAQSPGNSPPPEGWPKAGVGFLYTNRPDVIREMLETFVHQANLRGIEVRNRLAKVDTILVHNTPPGIAATHSHRNGCKITLRESDFDKPIKRLVQLYHELGHHFGLKDCYQCTYSIMAANFNHRGTYLFNDENIKILYIDLFFEALRNPKKYNAGHQHY